MALPNSSGTMMNTQALMSAALPATNAMSGNGTTGTVNHHRMETGPSHKSCFQKRDFSIQGGGGLYSKYAIW